MKLVMVKINFQDLLVRIPQYVIAIDHMLRHVTDPGGSRLTHSGAPYHGRP